MSTQTTIRIVNYAVNGSGVGHLTRLHAISRWVRRYAACIGVKAEVWFLTTSEADGILFPDRFPSFKLPSKSVIGEAGVDKLAYLALAKQWVWHSLALLRPDVLVVDTFPRGSFGELLSALDLCRQRAFVYRPTKESFSARADFQAMLPLYDLIVVPDHEIYADVQVPAAVRSRVRHVGPVMSRERAEMATREQARARFGIAADKTAICISSGGGGDATASAQFHTIVEALRQDTSLHLVVAAGPLYNGRPIHGDRITWSTSGALAEQMAGFDLAICAAGYNTFHELMHAGVPAIFLPQEKVADEQARRAARAVDRGAAKMLEVLDVERLRAAVAELREPAAREAASKAALALVPRNHARDAAAEILRLVVPAHDVDAAEEIVDDELLEAASRRGVSLDVHFQVMRALGTATDPKVLSLLAIDVVAAMSPAALGPPTPATMRTLDVLSRKLARATGEERARAACALLPELAPFDDWAGAAMLLSVFHTERALEAETFAAEVTTFVRALRTRGDDLYRGVAALSRAANGEGGAEGNLELLRAAQEPTS